MVLIYMLFSESMTALLHCLGIVAFRIVPMASKIMRLETHKRPFHVFGCVPMANHLPLGGCWVLLRSCDWLRFVG